MSQNATGSLAASIQSFHEVLEASQVLDAERAQGTYGANTLGLQRAIAGALVVRSASEVQQVVAIAAREGLALYPISAGRNAGYGGAVPVRDGCVILDLSQMKGIDAEHIELGVVSLEPGVTQQDLRAYLDEHSLPYLVPVHGGGPNCSLVGNALERGYGITPHADHFGAVTAIEAVLPNGELYRTPLSDHGAPLVDQVFKWGVGPYLDGLFTQSNLGIVVRMTLVLAPFPERIDTFFFGVARHEQLDEAVAAVREALDTLGGVGGSINLMNTRRILSMTVPYPEGVAPGEVMADDYVRQTAKANQVLPWTGIGALYGDRRLLKAARAIVRAKLRGVAKRLLFVNPGLVRRVRGAVSLLPGQWSNQFVRTLDTLNKSLALIGGKPSGIALPLAYWKAGRQAASVHALNPDQDGCGLIWYSPLVPMKPEIVKEYVAMVDRVCRRHGIEPLITLTSLSPRCFDSTVPLLFDPADQDASTRAHACYAELIAAGREIGVIPYRYPIDGMGYIVEGNQVYWQCVARLKETLDPKGICAPGRYA